MVGLQNLIRVSLFIEFVVDFVNGFFFSFQLLLLLHFIYFIGVYIIFFTIVVTSYG